MTRTLPITLLLAFSLPAGAVEPTRVFVAPFQARTRDAVSISSLIPAFLEQHLSAFPELEPVGVDDVGPVYDTSADLYLSSCPPGDEVGCAFVVAEVAHAAYALTGTVDSVGDASRVEVVIIDVLDSREVIRFQADLAVGDDEVFAEGVARVLTAVVRGEVGNQDDIRAEDDPEAAAREAARRAELQRQLSELAGEIGDVSTLTTREDLEVERPKVTLDDLAEQMDAEGVKPWERLGMGPKEYLRYKNSHLGLPEWRARSMGRKGELILRAGLQLGTGPSHGEYYGIYARSDQTLAVVDAYSYQAVTTGSGFGAQGSISYGLLPYLEAGVHVGTMTGRYGVLMDSYVVGDDHTLGDPEDHSNQVLSLGPQLVGSLIPTSVIRPVVGVEGGLTIGTRVTSRYLLTEDSMLDGFRVPMLWTVGGRVGAEARLADMVDVYLHLPFGAVVAGNTSDSTRVGGDGLDPGDIVAPPSLSPIYAGVTFGVQVRLFGAQPDTGSVLDTDML